MFVDDAAEIMRVAYEIISCKKQINEANADIIKCTSQIDSLQPWKTFDLSLRFKGTEKTQAFIGTFPAEISQGEILKTIAEKAPDIDGVEVEVISSDKNLTCVFILCKKKDGGDLFDVLRQMGFSSPAVDSKQTPVERISILHDRIKELEQTIIHNENIIKAHKGMLNAFYFIEDYYVMRAEKYEKIESLANTKHVFIQIGRASCRERV